MNEVGAVRDRLPPLPHERLTDEQRRVAEAIAHGPRGAVYGPFVPLLRSPELADCAQRMGEYLRFRSAIGTRLTELAILMVARHWNQAVEWAIHAPLAEDAGIAATTIAAIATARRPAPMSDDEATIYDFCAELARDKAVTDATFARAVARFGEQGVVDLAGINGYYTMLAMVLNVACTPAPSTPSIALAPDPS
jgi:4-carboxymuconolactone decarboxylase